MKSHGRWSVALAEQALDLKFWGPVAGAADITKVSSLSGSLLRCVIAQAFGSQKLP